MQLLIQEYLRRDAMETFKGLKGLKEEYGISARFSEDFPELVCLKYSQIDSSLGDPIVQQCRGIILNVQKDWEVVSRPYDKFFNYGEGHAADIDWNTARVYEKLDGSLMTLYFYKGKWRVQTSGTPSANTPVGAYDFTFKELFWKVFTELNYLIPAHEHSDLCFMFELMTKYNRVVVRHTENKLVLHGVRNVKTGGYHNINYWADKYNWQACNTFLLNDIKSIISTANKLDPLCQEGYIVEDADFNRIKIKSPSYVVLHHTRDSMSPRNMLNIIRTNENTEFLTYFPEYLDLYNEIGRKYKALIWIIEATIRDIYYAGIETDYKKIGLYTKDMFYNGAIFQVLRNKRTVNEILADMSIKKLESWLEIVKEKYNEQAPSKEI